MSADGGSTAIAVESPAPVVAGSGEAPAAPELGEIAGFRPHNDIAAVLGDGR
jgi:hypothetical protein